MSGIAFKTEEFGEALKDFEGQIVAVDYAEEPFGMKGAPGITRAGKVLCVQVRTEVYEKPQYEWYRKRLALFLHNPPSRVKKTKWAYLIEALNEVGAMKDVSMGGKTDDERMKSFAQSLLGMRFRFQELECESLVKESGVPKKFNIMLPVEYLGRKAIEEAPVVRQAVIGEAVSAPVDIETPSTPVDIDEALQGV